MSYLEDFAIDEAWSAFVNSVKVAMEADGSYTGVDSHVSEVRRMVEHYLSKVE